jgi:hypothetical protein
MDIYRIANLETGGESTHRFTSFLYISFCSMIGVQILNCQRCFDGVFFDFAKNLRDWELTGLWTTQMVGNDYKHTNGWYEAPDK